LSAREIHAAASAPRTIAPRPTIELTIKNAKNENKIASRFLISNAPPSTFFLLSSF
jgi:hypothetical protein